MSEKDTVININTAVDYVKGLKESPIVKSKGYVVLNGNTVLDKKQNITAEKLAMLVTGNSELYETVCEDKLDIFGVPGAIVVDFSKYVFWERLTDRLHGSTRVGIIIALVLLVLGQMTESSNVSLVAAISSLAAMVCSLANLAIISITMNRRFKILEEVTND